LSSDPPSDSQPDVPTGRDSQVEAWVRQTSRNESSADLPNSHGGPHVPPSLLAPFPSVLGGGADLHAPPGTTVVRNKERSLGMTPQKAPSAACVQSAHGSPTAADLGLSATTLHPITSSSSSSRLGCSSEPLAHASTHALLPSLPLEVGQEITPRSAMSSADAPTSCNPDDWTAGFYATSVAGAPGDCTAVCSKSRQARVSGHRRVRSGGDASPACRGSSSSSAFGGSLRSTTSSHRSPHGSTQRCGSFVSVLSPCDMPNPVMLTLFPEGGGSHHVVSGSTSEGSPHRLHLERSVRSMNASHGTMSMDFGTVVVETDTLSRDSDVDLVSGYSA
jgi:hypothetical protein